MKDKVLILISLVFLMLSSCYKEIPRIPYRMELLHKEIASAYKAMERGDMEASIESYKNALYIARSIQDEKSEAIILLNLSRLYMKKGDIESAVLCLDLMNRLIESSSMDEKTIMELKREYMLEMASMDILKGYNDNALSLLEIIINGNLSESFLGRAMNLKARILIMKGDRVESERLLEEALRLNRASGLRVEEANTLRLLGDLNLIHNPVKAIDYYRDALRIDKSLALPEKIGMDLEKIAEGYERLNDREMVLNYLIKAYDVWSTINRDSAERVLKKIERYR